MYIFDIDGTLSIVGERLKYLNQNKKDWDAFYEACEEDKLNISVANVCIALAQNHIIAYCTGRRESVRKKTENWLCKHDLPYADHLFMRKDGDFRHDTIVKPELISHIKISDINGIFEDRDCMVKKWRELGIICFQVDEGNF